MISVSELLGAVTDERDALTAQVEALTAQRDEAVRLLSDNSLTDALSSEAWDEWHEARDAFLRGVGQ